MHIPGRWEFDDLELCECKRCSVMTMTGTVNACGYARVVADN